MRYQGISTSDRLIFFGTLAMLVLAPTQWGFTVEPGIHVSPADPVLVLTAGLALFGSLCRRLGGRVLLPSPFALLFVFFAGLSILGAADRVEALKNAVQWFFYFVAAWMLFRYLLEEPGVRSLGLTLAGWVAVAVLLVAVVQFFQPGLEDLDVRGTFGNRNVLAGFLALALPFAFARALTGTNPMAALVGSLITLVGLSVVLSGAAVLGLIVALLSMAAARGRFATALTMGLLLFLLVLLHPNLPRRGEFEDPWLDSIALHDADGELSRRYPEWECAWLMMQDHPWSGVGAGNYQERIRDYRGRVATRPGEPEPDTQNLYLVLGASIGLPGLLMFAAMLLEGIAAALRATGAVRLRPAEQTLALGCFGGLLAFAITAIWHPLLVRGIGIPLVGVLALAHHLHARRVETGH